jgi:hypothetical protein
MDISGVLHVAAIVAVVVLVIAAMVEVAWANARHREIRRGMTPAERAQDDKDKRAGW